MGSINGIVTKMPAPTTIVTLSAVACSRPKCRCKPPLVSPTMFPPSRFTLRITVAARFFPCELPFVTWSVLHVEALAQRRRPQRAGVRRRGEEVMADTRDRVVEQVPQRGRNNDRGPGEQAPQTAEAAHRVQHRRR